MSSNVTLGPESATLTWLASRRRHPGTSPSLVGGSFPEYVTEEAITLSIEPSMVWRCRCRLAW